MRHHGAPRFHAYSAGSHPAGRIHPNAIQQIQAAGLSKEGLRSKSWDEFAEPGAPVMDFLFTLCDSAAAETCPAWPGHPATAHWGLPDPGNAVGGPQALEVSFRDAYETLDRRISLFLRLQFDKFDEAALQEELKRIGKE